MRAFLTNRGSSLYRGLAVPFSVFVLVSSLGLAGWISYWSQQDSLREFEQMAATNAKFVDELQLPRSQALAEKLSTILGVQVGFYRAGETNTHFASDNWPRGLPPALAEATSSNKPVAFRVGAHEVAVAPFDREQMHLVFVRETRSLLAAGWGDAVLIPTLVLTLACGCLAFYIAHRIVRPLGALMDWLPCLQRDDQTAPAIPESVSSRTDEIGKLARSLEETHQRLLDEQARRRQSERMATLGRIATSLAHEIRNPASSIRLHADLLARSPIGKESESVELIRTEVNRITDLVNQWLFVIRPAPPQTGKHDLVKLVTHVGDGLRAAMDHAHATLQIIAPNQPLWVACDHTRIEQVVRNLLVNASQAMPEGGDIEVHFESGEDGAVMTIQDSGPGFSDDALRRFGEPFFSEREGGMGIGLTLAREVIEAHRGRIDASNTSRGAMIRVQLPRA